MAEFDWKIIENYYVQEHYFIFEYKRSTMTIAKSVKLQTPFAQFMHDCFQCILRELQLISNMDEKDE